MKVGKLALVSVWVFWSLGAYAMNSGVKATYECEFSAGQDWPGDLRKQPATQNLFITSKPFEVRVDEGQPTSLSLGLKDLTERFDGDNDGPFNKEMAKGYDLETPFKMELNFLNADAVETALDWPLPAYGAQPLVLLNRAAVDKDNRLQVRYEIVPPHKDNQDPQAEYSAVHIGLDCKKLARP